MKNWSKDYNYCRSCYKTSHKHVCLGYCKKCYDEMDDKTAPPAPVKRRCLKCSEWFKSKHDANRRCEACIRKENNSKVWDRYKHRISL